MSATWENQEVNKSSFFIWIVNAQEGTGLFQTHLLLPEWRK